MIKKIRFLIVGIVNVVGQLFCLSVNHVKVKRNPFCLMQRLS